MHGPTCRNHRYLRLAGIRQAIFLTLFHQAGFQTK